MINLGQLTAELGTEPSPLQESHLEELRAQQQVLCDLLSHRCSGAADNGWVRLDVNGHQQVSNVWVSPTALERFGAGEFTDAVREALVTATRAWTSWFEERAQSALGIQPAGSVDWSAHAAKVQQALTTLMTTLRRHAPGHADLIETALTDVSEFHQATFTAASPEAEVTATVNARGELVSLDVHDVHRREVDNRTFAGWLESALTTALAQRRNRQQQVSQFSLPQGFTSG